jgi:hypothetical protein
MPSLFESIFGPGFNSQPRVDPIPPETHPPVNPDHIKRITISQLIERKDSLVRVNGKCYRFRVTEVELTK